MPAELMRRASRRLALTAFGVGLAFVISALVTNVVESSGWHRFSHPQARNGIFALVVAMSEGTAWVARAGGMAPARLLQLSLGYEVVVAFGIAMGDNLEPLPPELPLVAISWLCVWIVFFPLVVPAPPRWALLAGLAAATTWPLAYLAGLRLGNPPAAAHVLVLNVLENYIAVSLAMVATVVLRRLQELGCYHLEERLAYGGMGEIWRARHSMLARPVAVKLIRPELLGVKAPGEAAALVGRFRREAEATARLHSPHTVALHDFGVTPEGTFYYVMELLEGLDLETLVRRFGPLPPERVVHLLGHACESLADAHAAGLIHRDVKPANIVACRWGTKWDFVKVLDFGLVKTTWSLGDDDRLTVEGTIRGTPAYLAPEVAVGGPLDPRVDLYGLGCVGYWLLAGEAPFAGSSALEVILHHVKTPPVPPSRRVAGAIPEDLEALVLSCLAKDPLERPPSAQSLAERLAGCRTAQPWSQQRAREWWEKNVPPPEAAPA
jgi:serine/threonine-protein kinase